MSTSASTPGELLRSLHATRDFEAAAARALDAMLAHLTTAAAPATVLRGMVHLRPGGAYAGVLVREARCPEHPASRAPTIVPSSTAWHWVDRVRAPLALDVGTGRALGADGSELATPRDLRLDFRSRELVMGRQATHILALPLRRPGGGVDGFISMELSAAGGLGHWSALAAALQDLADTAAPFVRELPRAVTEPAPADPDLPVVGRAMRSCIADLRLFAAEDETLLLLGETGVGKSVLAQWCCNRSPRAGRPFVPVNLIAYPPDLRAGALFGWVRGAFTGATEDRKGLVADAQGGTLFIDEIDKLPIDGQAMLLELLESGSYRVLGDSTQRHADVRFMVSTNADLLAEIEAGRFLRDLYYRIQVFPVRILPLRERRDEIVPWAEHLMRGMHQHKDRGVTMEPAAGALLAAQLWPGNLRQLRSVVKRAYTLATAGAGDAVHVALAHVQRALHYDGAPASEHDVVTAFERAADAFVTAALERPDGLSLDLTRALGGYVLSAAIERLGDARAACMRLGRGKDVDGNNHHKLVKRERGYIDELAAALSGARGGNSGLGG
jgi:DNA-binding NtrC family response regulator